MLACARQWYQPEVERSLSHLPQRDWDWDWRVRPGIICVNICHHMLLPSCSHCAAELSLVAALTRLQMSESGTHINPGSIPSGIGKVGPKAFPRVAMDLATTVERIQQNFVICDPSLPDCPIVFASDAFLDLTEFPREEVLGRNCRFLQVRCDDESHHNVSKASSRLAGAAPDAACQLCWAAIA